MLGLLSEIKWEKLQRHEREVWNNEIEKLHLRILALENKPTPLQSSDTTLKSRLEDLEVWRGKMHELLITTTPATKKEKLNSIALAKLSGRF